MRIKFTVATEGFALTCYWTSEAYPGADSAQEPDDNFSEKRLDFLKMHFYKTERLF